MCPLGGLSPCPSLEALMATTPFDPLDETVVTRVVAAVLREVAGGTPPRAEPEFMTDDQIRRHFFGDEHRVIYWRRTKDPTFPPAVALGGRTKLRRVANIRAWLAFREVS